MNMNKMIEQMEKSYNGGTTETKEEPKLVTNNRMTQVEIKPTIKQAPVVAIATPPPKSNIPKIPGVPVPPPLNIPVAPKIVNITLTIINRIFKLNLRHKKIKLQN